MNKTPLLFLILFSVLFLPVHGMGRRFPRTNEEFDSIGQIRHEPAKGVKTITIPAGVTADGDCLDGISIRNAVKGNEITDEEKVLLHTVGFWTGFEELCVNIYEVELAECPKFPIEPGSFISSENANGNGFVIRGCHLGRTRGQGILLRASNGVIENNFLDHNFGPGIGCNADVV